MRQRGQNILFARAGTKEHQERLWSAIVEV